MKTFDEIRAFVVSKVKKSEKIAFLVREGFTKSAAESAYDCIMTEFRFSLMREGRRFTIGVEIEAINVDRDSVMSSLRRRGLKSYNSYGEYNHRDSGEFYKFMCDGSLDGVSSDSYEPCEIVSPVLHDISGLKPVCESLYENGAYVNSSCGLHVHFGAEDFTPAQWARILVNYGHIERVIDSIMPPSRRAENNRFCRSVVFKSSVVESRPDEFATFDDLRVLLGSRYYKVNLESFLRHKTIEFRQHSGTINYTKIKNWVGFLSSFLEWTLGHEEYMYANCVDQLPFLSADQKRYYNRRVGVLA